MIIKSLKIQNGYLRKLSSDHIKIGIIQIPGSKFDDPLIVVFLESSSLVLYYLKSLNVLLFSKVRLAFPLL